MCAVDDDNDDDVDVVVDDVVVIVITGCYRGRQTDRQTSARAR